MKICIVSYYVSSVQNEVAKFQFEILEEAGDIFPWGVLTQVYDKVVSVKSELVGINEPHYAAGGHDRTADFMIVLAS